MTSNKINLTAKKKGISNGGIYLLNGNFTNLVPFALTMALKITQGSSLVTMFTTPAIVAPILPALSISL
jgi:H+/gluconate symporter-like permease